MPPLDRRRRRRFNRAVWISLLLALALFLLIGGAVKVGRASRPYTVDIDRSYALQASALVEQSNQQAAQLNRLLTAMPGLARPTLQARLDELVTDSAGTAAAAAALSPPSPADGLGEGFASALGERAAAVGLVRSAVDGLLGMAPQPVTGALGAPSSSAVGSSAAVATLLPSDRAAARLTRAGSALTRSDQAYAGVRRAFLLAPGDAHLPASVWVHDPTRWAPGPVQTL
ncbi:MAG TPA: hypothetical protein VKG43_03915, partial [Acidimicrobiales bacterium]|nr:hypothetical protein [Acidimicrobiales bacterium]